MLAVLATACAEDASTRADDDPQSRAAELLERGPATPLPSLPLIGRARSDTPDPLILDVRVESTTDRVAFGDRFVLNLRIATRDGYVIQPEPQPELEALAPELRAPASTTTVGPWQVREHRLVFVAERIDRIEIPSLVVRAHRAAADQQPAASAVAFSDPIELEVISGLEAADDGSAEPPGEWIPLHGSTTGWFVAGILVLFGALAFGWLRRQCRATPPPPRDWATELQRLREAERGSPADLADRLAHWTRAALERVGIPATTTTPAELAADTRDDTGLRATGAELLHWCDRVRFEPRSATAEAPWHRADALARAASTWDDRSSTSG